MSPSVEVQYFIIHFIHRYKLRSGLQGGLYSLLKPFYICQYSITLVVIYTFGISSGVGSCCGMPGTKLGLASDLGGGVSHLSSKSNFCYYFSYRTCLSTMLQVFRIHVGLISDMESLLDCVLPLSLWNLHRILVLKHSL